ncbi:sulfatase [Bacteroidia bacterium]|nr:sulfatase [Bacteroidia bacterium]
MKTYLEKAGTLAAMALAGLPLHGAQQRAAAGNGLNVLMILVDDMGWRDLASTGSNYYQTPNIDRLAARGVTFANGYAACSVSSPSRASLLTGKATTRHGITSWIGDPSGMQWAQRHNARVAPPDYVQQISDRELLLPQELRRHGYATLLAGKWHLGDLDPKLFGFDVNKGGYASGSPHGGYFSPYHNPALLDGPAGEDLTLRLARETADFIEQQATAGKPFFAYLSFYAVHGPIQTTRERWSLFRDSAETMGIAPAGFAIDRTLPVRQAQDNPVYAGLISSVDDAVGMVAERLEKLGIVDKTLIIFTSDNGGVSSGDNYSTSNLPLRGGKGRQWEGGVRVPLIVVAPGMGRPGSVDPTPVIHMDIYPTTLDMAGLPLLPAQHVDGVSLRPLIERGRAPASRTLYWHFPHYGNQGGEPASYLREGPWKLIFYHEDGRLELYNLTDDPGEQTSIAMQHPARVRELKAKLDRWLTQTHARMPEANPQFDAARSERQLADKQRKTMAQQERLRLEQLRRDFRPDDTWWGSCPTVD